MDDKLQLIEYRINWIRAQKSAQGRKKINAKQKQGAELKYLRTLSVNKVRLTKMHQVVSNLRQYVLSVDIIIQTWSIKLAGNDRILAAWVPEHSTIFFNFFEARNIFFFPFHLFLFFSGCVPKACARNNNWCKARHLNSSKACRDLSRHSFPLVHFFLFLRAHLHTPTA